MQGLGTGGGWLGRHGWVGFGRRVGDGSPSGWDGEIKAIMVMSEGLRLGGDIGLRLCS